ncbi:MAG: PTS sugar transporter subunit IIC [Clostridium sp.]|uniref:PTS sugar transporter subunit IIC n=1 Tax=Clostridium sp. TaxID=1506 RepID=UPI003F2D8F90
MFSKIQSFLEKFVGPIAQKMADSRLIQSLTNGMMAVLPVSLGVAFIAIVGNFPIEAWQDFLWNIGLGQVIQDTINITSGLYAVYIVCTIAYETAKIEEENPITCVILSLAFFLILAPQIQMDIGGGEFLPVLATSSIGSDGIFVAIIVGIAITRLYSYLMTKNLKIKLPESVPTMVTDSLSPTFVAMIIFVIAFAVKAIFNSTGFGDAMTFVNTMITQPITAVGVTPLSIVLIFTFANILWFFGIHPSAIINIFYAIAAPVLIANVNAFLGGQPLPHLEMLFMLSIIMVGGTGNTLGLAICMLFAKSERFKALNKVSFVPSIFNINEPLIFGVPVMLNPIFFIPLILSTSVGGIIIHLFYKMGFLSYYNPTVELPWVTPPVVLEWFESGFKFVFVMIVVIAALTLLYLPFFKMADKNALKEEKELEAVNHKSVDNNAVKNGARA